MSKPNIIFYFSDQQRADTCGCYGQKLPVTPNLDRLAQEGCMFEYAFTCQPVCGPARACLQTGVYATENGCTTNGIPLVVGEKTLAHYFNEAGYDTAYIGKWHLASDDKNSELDFTQSAIPKERRGGYRHWMASDLLEFTSHGYNGFLFDGDNNKVEFVGYRADCINNYAIDYLHNRDKEKPFFMFISQIEPHHQNDHDVYEGPDGSKQKFADYEVPGDLVGTGGDWRENYPDYLGQCNSLDYNVGRLMDTLEAQGIAENTIIIYTADHGSHFRTRVGEYKRACQDSCLRIPMIAWGKDFMGKGVQKELASLIDIPATLLDCAGIIIPENYKGSSLKSLVNGENETWREEVFAQISESQVARCIRDKKYKYSVRANADAWGDKGASEYYEDYLYDLEKDPFEKNNLVADESYAEIREELAKRLVKNMVAAKEEHAKILPYCEMPEHMRGLGPDETAY